MEQKQAAEKPSKFGRAEKRLRMIESINDAAADVFIRDGYADFSARKVAKELGISLSNLQHYCGNTDDLCFQMIKAKLEYYVILFRETYTNPELTPEEKLKITIRDNIHATYDDITGKLFLQIGALATRNERIKEVMVEQYDFFLEGLRIVISEINPLLDQSRVLNYSALIATMIEGNFFYQWQGSMSAIPREEMINTAIKLWINILKAP